MGSKRRRAEVKRIKRRRLFKKAKCEKCGKAILEAGGYHGYSRDHVLCWGCYSVGWNYDLFGALKYGYGK